MLWVEHSVCMDCEKRCVCERLSMGMECVVCFLYNYGARGQGWGERSLGRGETTTTYFSRPHGARLGAHSPLALA
jgi:hypothetical protein